MTEPQTLTFNAGVLARGWLATAQATGNDDSAAILDGTLNLEVFSNGVRLTATNRYMLLTTWVPTLGGWAEPTIDEAPDVTLTFRDDDARAKGLLTYLLKLAKRAAKDHNDPPHVHLLLGVTPEEDDEPGFPGMEREQVALEFPGNEMVRCDVVEGSYPNWRTLLARHKPTKTDNVVLNSELLARIADVGKILGTHLRFTSGGENRMVALAPAVTDDSGVTLRGGLMPIQLANSAADAA